MSPMLRLVGVRQMQGEAGEGVLTYSEPAPTRNQSSWKKTRKNTNNLGLITFCTKPKNL